MEKKMMVDSTPGRFGADTARAISCGILALVGCLALVSGSVFLVNGAIHGASRSDLVFFGAVACAGVVLCAGSIFLAGRGGAAGTEAV